MLERYERAHVCVYVCACACARRCVRVCVCVGDGFRFAFCFAWVRACGCVRVCVCACGWGGVQGRGYFGAPARAMDLYDTPRTQRDKLFPPPRTQRGKPRTQRDVARTQRDMPLAQGCYPFTTHLGAIPLPQTQWLFPFPLLPVILPPSYLAASCPPSVILLLVISFGCGISLTAVEIIDGVGV